MIIADEAHLMPHKKGQAPPDLRFSTRAESDLLKGGQSDLAGAPSVTCWWLRLCHRNIDEPGISRRREIYPYLGGQWITTLPTRATRLRDPEQSRRSARLEARCAGIPGVFEATLADYGGRQYEAFGTGYTPSAGMPAM